MKRNSIFCAFLLIFSIALLSLSQPSLFFEDGLSFLAWFSYIPFFILLEKIQLKKSFFWGFSYGALLYLCLCWWLSSFGVVAISFVCVLFGFYHALLFLILVWSKNTFPCKFNNFFWIFRVFVLISFDFIRTKGIFGFAYGIIGYSQWQNPVFLRFSSLFGVNGVSLLIYLFASVCAKIIMEKNVRSNLKNLSVCLSIILSAAVFSLIPCKNSAFSSLNVALIQNASTSDAHGISGYEKTAVLLKKLTDEALASHPETELVVWAETAIVPDIIYHSKNPKDRRRHELSVGLLDYFKKSEKSFLIGNNYRDADGNHNSALYFSPDSENPAVYSKNHLVPFTEFWPDILDFKIFDKIKKSLDCENFSHGKAVTGFKISGMNFYCPICFEDSFSPLVRRMKQGRADFFVNISDDAWSHSAAAQKMHLSMSAFRCAEFRTPMIRSTVDGKTCAIDSFGKVSAEIEWGSDGFLCTAVQIPESSKTLYLLIGDIPLICVMIMTLLFLLILSVRFVKVSVYGRR